MMRPRMASTAEITPSRPVASSTMNSLVCCGGPMKPNTTSIVRPAFSSSTRAMVFSNCSIVHVRYSRILFISFIPFVQYGGRLLSPNRRRRAEARIASSGAAAFQQRLESVEDALRRQVLVRQRTGRIFRMREHGRIGLEDQDAAVGQQRETVAGEIRAQGRGDGLEGAQAAPPHPARGLWRSTPLPPPSLFR